MKPSPIYETKVTVSTLLKLTASKITMFTLGSSSSGNLTSAFVHWQISPYHHLKLASFSVTRLQSP